MQVLVLYNPISGAGRSAETARALVQRLNEAGHHARALESRLVPAEEWLEGELADCELLVIVGGDGAVRMSSQSAVRTGTPIYQVREFGMDRSAETLLGAIDRFQVRKVDLGEADGRPFLLMVSVGYDAAVVDDLARCRGRSISHLSYLAPMLRQFLRWRPPRLEVVVDGERLEVSGGCGSAMRGWLVVANSRQYAARLNPAPMADMSDGLLDVVYVPMRSRMGLLRRMISYRLGRQARDTAAVHRRGREVEVRVDPSQFWQLDGDPPGPAGGCQGGEGKDRRRVDCVRISLHPRVLPVLIP